MKTIPTIEEFVNEVPKHEIGTPEYNHLRHHFDEVWRKVNESRWFMPEHLIALYPALRELYDTIIESEEYNARDSVKAAKIRAKREAKK